MNNTNTALDYKEKVIIEKLFSDLMDWSIDNNKDKKQILDEAVEVFGSLKETNALTIKELNARAVNETLQELATKDFVRAEISEVRAEIANVRTELKTEISEVKNSLIKWVIGVGISAVIISTTSFWGIAMFLVDRLGK